MNSIELMSQITHYTKYAKYLPEKNRRETWKETVERNCNMHMQKYPFLRERIADFYENFVITKRVLPSMRSLQFGGKPIEINESRIYNCAYATVDSWQVFHEVMFLLLGGTGVGYSIQKQHVRKLPSIRKPVKQRKFVIQDDVIGWSEAVKALMRAYLDGGFLPKFYFGDIRPKGALLKTSGGKAPGAEGLKSALLRIEQLLESKQNGQKLTPLECHDIFCFIADAVLSGGIRRAAMIALFSMDDEAMIHCKSDFKVEIKEEWPLDNQHYQVRVETVWNSKEHQLIIPLADYEKLKSKQRLPWWYFEGQRAVANNSAVFLRHKITEKDFFDFWDSIKKHNTGEPGIYFSNNADWGANPCVEIGLRAHQFCNLTEINGGLIHTQQDLNECAQAAAFLGTIQAGYTDFHYLREIWRENTEKDSLLGISITGIAGMDYHKFDFPHAVKCAIEENEKISKLLGIKKAARLTCVKPSGTTSLILGTSSGCHAWFSQYYIRRMKINKQEAIFRYLKEKIPFLLEDDHFSPDRDAFICIPMKAPQGAITESEETAEEFLRRIEYFSAHWIQPGHIKGDNSHNISATVKVAENEWDAVGRWMWDHRAIFNGLSVLPKDTGSYIQAPHEKIDEKRYLELIGYLKALDLSEIQELYDTTTRSSEVACAGGQCEY